LLHIAKIIYKQCLEATQSLQLFFQQEFGFGSKQAL
jgi:hypothetical protein